MLKWMLSGALGLMLMAGSALAQEREIEEVIGAQIEAFRTEDVGRAFGYASPTIKRLFGTPGNFGRMVEQGYPMVWRPDEICFLDLREVAGNLWQRVQIRDRKGRVHVLDYQMVETENGWKINGVQILRAPGVAA
ncbi:MAG TPA: DUF4864 domain-containing protein [Rhodobacteraceae bacterium]|jgi:hypothetical protein|nr:DUF4864 domain-containing protein [Paracoccaceae bacterium]